MENKEKYVYYDKDDYEFKEIAEEYLESPEKLKEYFGYLDEYLDEGEFIIYKLVPYKTLQKTYKFKE